MGEIVATLGCPGVMHIIGGRLRGRKLQPLEGEAIRPTAARTREAIFNILIHRRDLNGDSYIIGQRMADFCCGSGAMGLEAISRGAETCLFLDHNKRALEIAQDNAEKLGVTAQCDFVHGDVNRLPPTSRPCRVIFCDPPYELTVRDRLLPQLLDQGWLTPGGLLVFEHSAKNATASEVPGYVQLLGRDYGKARVEVWEAV